MIDDNQTLDDMKPSKDSSKPIKSITYVNGSHIKPYGWGVDYFDTVEEAEQYKRENEGGRTEIFIEPN